MRNQACNTAFLLPPGRAWLRGMLAVRSQHVRMPSISQPAVSPGILSPGQCQMCGVRVNFIRKRPAPMNESSSAETAAIDSAALQH